mgnify:FL=1
MLIAIRFIYLFSLVIWIGSILFFSFFAAPSIFKVLPRETAGEVVGDIFPKYWMIGYISGIVSILSVIIIYIKEKGNYTAIISVLAIMTILTFYSGMAVGQKARAIKAEIKITEDASKKEGLKKEFSTVHRKSAILNGIILALGIILIFLTASSMRV